MMKNTIILLLLVATLNIFAQSRKDSILLTNTEWVNKDLDYLRFDNEFVVSNFSNAKQQLYYDLKNKKLSLKVNYRVGSDHRTEKFDFKIKHIQKNKLILVPIYEKTNDKGRFIAKSILKEKQYVFYNRGQLISKINFNKITFHASTCFGTCPSLSIEIDNLGNIFYQGRYYTKKFRGNYIGKLSKKEMLQFRKILNRSQLKVLDQKWKQITSTKDKPRYNYIIELSNGRLLEINTNDQHPILDRLSEFLINIPKVADLKRERNKHKFQVSHKKNYRITAN